MSNFPRPCIPKEEDSFPLPELQYHTNDSTTTTSSSSAQLKASTLPTGQSRAAFTAPSHVFAHATPYQSDAEAARDYSRCPDVHQDPLLWPKARRWSVRVSSTWALVLYTVVFMLIAIIVVLATTHKTQKETVTVSPHFYVGSGTQLSLCPSTASTTRTGIEIPTITITKSIVQVTSTASLSSTTTILSTVVVTPEPSGSLSGPSVVLVTTTPKSGTVTSVVLQTATINPSQAVVTQTIDIGASQATLTQAFEAPVPAQESKTQTSGAPLLCAWTRHTPDWASFSSAGVCHSLAPLRSWACLSVVPVSCICAWSCHLSIPCG
ncbi:hypothetical protein EJ08DRAFT_735736 [Tothia fuscella]|uniref:Uncharacterized protein n=1 Tax=Tothia fuscella TaxID=1048955 RepID=A0A9P4NNJ7_9PEZI|nr:hypothetical protein EJ08DRAFT_735736 [Tothia fuscella]